MSIRTSLAALALAATALATGCGGSQGLSRSQLIAKADLICKRTNEKIHASNLGPRNIIRLAPGLAVYEEQSAAELAKLQPPSSMADDWKTIVDDFQVVGRSLAEIGHAKSLKEAIPSGNTISRAQGERARAAQRNGFRDCAQY